MTDAEGGEQGDLRAEAAKKILFMKILDEGARRRLNNIRFANPEFGEKIEHLVMQIVSSGRMKVVDEATLISLINKMRGPQRETKIIRK